MRDLIEKELEFSCEVISSGHEVVPRFLINTPDGDYTIFCPLPDAVEVRSARLALVSCFMTYKLTTSFIMSSELLEPDAASSTAVSRQASLAGLRMIKRKPLRFGQTIWLDADQIGDEVPALLPARHEELSTAQIAEIETAIRTVSPSGISKR